MLSVTPRTHRHVKATKLQIATATLPQNGVYLKLTEIILFVGECPSIDFETKMYEESLDVLDHHVKATRTVPGVVLEQAYLTKMADGIKPLSQSSNEGL